MKNSNSEQDNSRDDSRSPMQLPRKPRPRPQALDASFWNSRYEEEDTGWDVGYATKPITDWFLHSARNGLSKDAAILIPGAGRAYEAEFLHRNGFSNVHVLDWSEAPLKALAERVGDFPSEHLHQGDFFRHEGEYEVLVEQTFFCALDPALREDWADHSARLLKPGGCHVGLFFDFPFDPGFGPPFGGSEEEYRKILSRNLSVEILEPSRNSIDPRQGSEFFFVARKI